MEHVFVCTQMQLQTGLCYIYTYDMIFITIFICGLRDCAHWSELHS